MVGNPPHLPSIEATAVISQGDLDPPHRGNSDVRIRLGGSPVSSPECPGAQRTLFPIMSGDLHQPSPTRRAARAHAGVTARAVDNRPCRQHGGACPLQGLDHVLRAAAGGDHVFDDDPGFARGHAGNRAAASFSLVAASRSVK